MSQKLSESVNMTLYFIHSFGGFQGEHIGNVGQKECDN